MHAYKMNAHEVYSYEMHAREMRADKTHVHEMHADKTHVHEMHADKTHAYEMHAHETHAYEIHALEMHARKVLENLQISHPTNGGAVVDLSRSELQNMSFCANGKWSLLPAALAAVRLSTRGNGNGCAPHVR
jgi:hypothetical protein